MPTKTIGAIYRHGVVKPRRKLPFLDGTFLKLTITIPPNPVRQTGGMIRVAPRTAHAIIYGDEADFFGS